MKQVHYITYNDVYSGIYQSQVIDVVTYLNTEFHISVKLIAFVPLRLWKNQSRIIKDKLPSAKVYPILGSLDKISRTRIFLYLYSNKNLCICRGSLAFSLANNLYLKQVYDGRAAVEAEVMEYNVTGSSKLNELFIESENKAINTADYFISVSSKLVEYWEKKMGYKIPSSKYSIIPCTLTSKSIELNSHNVESEKIKVVYSGGTGAWQSFDRVVALLDQLMNKQENVEVLFLTKENKILDKLIEKYPNRCKRKWLKHNEVYNELCGCDYGILIRDDKVTNRVASPVKFAEYLNAGLKVLISPNIGDFSEFTKKNNCGLIVEQEIEMLNNVSIEEQNRIHQLCLHHFMKNSLNNKYNYERLLKACKLV